jgi:hypothetical protein
MGWTDVLAIDDENPRARLAAEVLACKDYGTTAARVKAFMQQGAAAGRRSLTSVASSAAGTGPVRNPTRESLKLVLPCAWHWPTRSRCLGMYRALRPSGDEGDKEYRREDFDLK